MKVTFLLSQSLESPSGLGRYWPLSKEMVRLGHQVTILALHHNFRDLQRHSFFRDGVEVCYVGQMHVLKQGDRKLHFAQGHLAWVVIVATWRLTRAALRSQTDCYHVGKPHPMNGIAGWLAARLRRVPLAVDCDDYEAESNRYSGGWQRPVIRLFEGWLPRQATAVTVNSRFLQDMCTASKGERSRIVRVSNGVDRERFGSVSHAAVESLRREWGLSERPIVAYVGTLSLASHPVDLLIDAFAMVRQRIPQAALLLIGGGDDYDYLTELVNKAELKHTVHLVGRVDPESIPAYLALADVTVDPVLDDLTARARSPLKVFESLAVGTPVVTGDIGDRREILEDGAAGILVTPGDARALADGIAAVLTNHKLRREMKREAQRISKQYYWDTLATTFLKAYEGTTLR